MPRFVRRVLPLAVALHAAAAPLAAQFYTNALPTRELYRLARERAAGVNDRCVGSLSDYLEAVSYMYAYLQAAGNDGSFRSDPGFAAAFQGQFDLVLRRARSCLKAYEPISSANMRGDSPLPARQEAPPPGVALAGEPPASSGAPESGGGGLTIRPKVVVLSPGASQQYLLTTADGGSVDLTSTGGSITPGAVYTAGSVPGAYTLIARRGELADTAWILVAGGSPQTDARGRTLEQLSAEADRLAQENAGLVAEIQRLRTPASAPTPARLGVEYRVRTKADNRYWHLDGNGDNLLSTRVQPDDDFTRFIIEGSGTGGYRIRNKATGRYLAAHDQGSNFLINSVAVPDERTVFYLNIEPDGSYRIISKVLNRFVHEDGNNSRLVTTLYQVDDDFTRFFFEP